ncbi:N-acetylmuramoyl-L-alanine amidase [Streptomyces sp. NA02950]|uniref:peptidoglycan recognition protein family protein n=1 Tax=Streptomyces sp. NA02950 TaxID=2742137 RepID=UPI001591171A|nr:N-acetylmuramoyl-L-alanine amidase [Streptomyces sp. NA02950]QKV94595.1 N-acetylmuramoyl-L-alanine amidase [Streptomyces sp. NA02950]
MRALLASSIGVVGTVALALPLTLHTASAHPRGVLPGGTQSLPLRPPGVGLARSAVAPGGAPGVVAQGVRPFSLVGVVWDDADAELGARVQVRTRATATGLWSPWRDLEPYGDEAPDPVSPDRTGARAHGGTAPLWVGDADGVQARVRPATMRAAAAALPVGTRLQLVDPGEAASAAPSTPAVTTPRALPVRPTRGPAVAPTPSVKPKLAKPAQPLKPVRPAKPRQPAVPTRQLPTATATSHTAPKPRIITRAAWGADETIREKGHVYSKTVKVAFIHHTVTGNAYRCSQVPSLLRGIYRYHVKSMGWRDYGYNFTVDKCGNIYEGRSGGVARAVMGAHTRGFNTKSMGVGVLGTFDARKPSKKAVNAIAELTAWKLGLFNRNPKAVVHLVSGGGNKYTEGTSVRLNVISGHRDGFATDCPGQRLYDELGSVRRAAARLQGR